MDRITRLFPILLFAAVAGCGDGSTAPKINQRSGQPSFDLTQSPSCPATATFTVTDEATLQTASKAVKPGDVIAVRGMIGLTADVFLSTPDVTLTCATPNAGLFALSTAVDALIVVTAGGSGVVVAGLVLDASGTVGGPYFAGDTSSLPGSIVAVAKVRFSNHTVTCGPGFCTFFSGTPGAMVFGNTFMTAGSSTGIHMQGAGPTVLAIPIDGSRVEGNTVVTTAPPCTFFFLGGIRTIGGRRVVIRDNVVRGSWCASISASILTESMITDNRFEGAAGNGIEFGNGRGGVTARIRVQKTVVLHNTASGAGKAGLDAAQACYNRFVDNELEGNAADLGIVLGVTTGANLVAGDDNAFVLDLGAFDCAGDGVITPNIITGQPAGRGVDPAELLSDHPVMKVHGIVVQ